MADISARPASAVAAVVLAAGRASRFGAGPDGSKVFALLDGRPLVAHVVATARASGAAPILVVTGHAGHLAEAALHDDMPDRFIANPDHATGLSSSLRAGIAAVPDGASGALVLLADMPLVSAATLQALIRTLALGSCDAVVPEHRGRRGNPVLLARSLFAGVMHLAGDEGARRLLAEPGRRIRSCPVDDPGILADIDTPEALAAARREGLRRR